MDIINGQTNDKEQIFIQIDQFSHIYNNNIIHLLVFIYHISPGSSITDSSFIQPSIRRVSSVMYNYIHISHLWKDKINIYIALCSAIQSRL